MSTFPVHGTGLLLLRSDLCSHSCCQFKSVMHTSLLSFCCSSVNLSVVMRVFHLRLGTQQLFILNILSVRVSPVSTDPAS